MDFRSRQLVDLPVFGSPNSTLYDSRGVHGPRGSHHVARPGRRTGVSSELTSQPAFTATSISFLRCRRRYGYPDLADDAGASCLWSIADFDG